MDFTQVAYQRLVDKWPVVLVAVIALVAAGVVPHVLNALQISKIPIIGSELGSLDKRRQAYISSARKLYNDGYHKVRLTMLPKRNCDRI